MSLMTTVTALIATELRASLRHNLRLSGIYAVAGLGILGGICFGLSAIHRAIAEAHGPLYADIVVGGGLLVLAAILIGIAQYLNYRAKRRANLARALAAAPVAAGMLFKKPKIGLAAIFAVIVVGALAGRSISK